MAVTVGVIVDAIVVLAVAVTLLELEARRIRKLASQPNHLLGHYTFLLYGWRNLLGHYTVLLYGRWAC